MKQNFSSILFVFIALLCEQVYSQEQQVSSLLSNYGLGVKFSESTMMEKSQGDLAVVNNNTQEVISIANPALLSNLQLTSFSLSFQALGANVKTQDVAYNSSSISISDLSFGVPLGTKGGFAMGLRIDSATGFEIENDEFYNFGNGSVNHLYAGFGYEVYKGLSLGVQLNQYFGRTEKLRADKNTQQSAVREYDYNTKATTTKFGLEYKYAFSKAIEARVGAYGVLGYDVQATGKYARYLAIETSENTFTPAESFVEDDVEGIEKNPFKSVIGAGVGKVNNWFVGVSYEKQDALQYSGNIFNETINASSVNSSSTIVPVNFEAKSKISLGGYLIPKKYALKNYFKRVNYRAGVKYEKTGLLLNNNSVKNLGISFGLGMPVGRRVSYANFSFELGRLGEFSKNKYQEKYFNVGVNFSLSDKWFNKRVIE